MVLTGIDQIETFADKYSGNIGYLCHSASVDRDLNHGISRMVEVFGNRLVKLFSPQHGLVGDVQDNMIESDHYEHPYYKLPVYSLYSETREPTQEMLEGLDVVFCDLQDVGTRVYTYIYTVTNTMIACAKKGVKVVILDRPNPIDAETIEGNILDPEYSSFVGMYPIPMRHGLTVGEVATMAKKFWEVDCELEVIRMQNYVRSMTFQETGLPWVIPSPNLPFIDTAFVYPGSVLFEGTSVSEGRGTTRSLEILGHPSIEPHSFVDHMNQVLAETDEEGFVLRPVSFIPTFHKFQGQSCGGVQIHPTDYKKFNPWRIGQILCKEFYHTLGYHFKWKQPPYEYEYEKLPIDILNGTDKIRTWVEDNGSYDELIALEKNGREKYLEQRSSILLY